MTKQQRNWHLADSYTQLPHIFYKPTNPTPVKAPKLLIFNEELAAWLGLDTDFLRSDQGIDVLAGNAVPEGANPIAQAYTGHQFGMFTMLGDGRAVLLGEHNTPQHERVDIQLKGAGRTNYSRGGDGRAALGPMLREYMISEAMHGLGVPTTRSLAVVSTGEPIMRETPLTGAVLTRVAKSHLRVGTFQYAARFGSFDDVKALADYAIDRHYPELNNKLHPYLSFFQEVIKEQASLVAKWQLVGFIHGVMNTDNMAISGETIDYGPCAFMDTYDPRIVFSSIDVQGRYAYSNQPPIAHWNLARLGEAMLSLIDEDEDQAVKQVEKELEAFPRLFNDHWMNGMRAKLGLFNEEPEDDSLITSLLDIMKTHKADYTNTFLGLTYDKLDDATIFSTDDFRKWHKRWLRRVEKQHETDEERKDLMRCNNPAVIPRNHRVEEALTAAVDNDDLTLVEELLHLMKDPYAHTDEQIEYAKAPIPEGPYTTYCGT
ncbi:UPF0061 protein [Lentibacillus sp. JNUCC-1]|uniref:protein adenylyltransferase SelO n=1 Tax=Lentibacillus sp. JNUCC-1 TaxID=2654513 RepID=UPI0012E7EDDA|nr:YdiU family protein [Lentibacillus sp. JNUCC-1]MUV37667.1 UPF0061 protein [Lentibacillus sp. JNUCC-1]